MDRIFSFTLKKSATEVHEALSNIYNEATTKEFRFKNGDFYIEDLNTSETEKVFELEALRNEVKVKKNGSDP